MTLNVTASNVALRATGTNSSLALKAPVRCATTGPIALSGLQTIDGITFQLSDVAFPNTGVNTRVLVKDQLDQTTNGIWVVNTDAWARAADFDSNDDCAQGTRIPVAQGLTNSGMWILTTADPVRLTNSGLGVSSITFAADPSNSAANSAISAANSAATALAAANVTGPIKFYATKAEANAALAGLSNLQILEVLVDESDLNHRTMYRVESGSLVLKLDLTQPVGVVDANLHFGIVADSTATVAGTDNTTAMRALASYLATTGNCTVIWPKVDGGVVGFTGFTWFFSGRGSIRHVFGSPLRNIDTGSNKGNTISWKSGSVENWSGGFVATDQLPFPINTVAAGSSTVTLVTAVRAADFAPGAWVRVCGYDQQGFGSFPPNLRYNEWRRVVSSNVGTGVITLDKPLVNSYNANWYVYTDTGFAILDTGYVQTVGPAGILPLDRGTSSRFTDLLMIENLTILNNPADTVPVGTTSNGEKFYSSGFVGINGAAHVIVRNVRAGYAFLGECPLAEFYNCDLSDIEPDKNSGILRFTRCSFGDVLGGTGYDKIEMYECTVRGVCQVSPKHFKAEKCKFLTEQTQDAFNYNAFCREITELRDCTFTRTGNNYLTIGQGLVSATVSSSFNIPLFRWTVFDAPSSSTFRVAKANDLTTNVNMALRVVLVKDCWLYRQDGRRFRVTDVTWDGSYYTVSYVSEDANTTIAAADVLGANRSRRWYFENARRADGWMLPAAYEVDADVYVNPNDGHFERMFDIVFPAAAFYSTADTYQWIGGAYITEIDVEVIRAYTGAGLPNGGYVKMLGQEFGSGTFWSNYMFIKSSTTGRRLILRTGSAGAGVDNRPTGDFIRDINTESPFLYRISLSLGDADNVGSTGWDGWIRIKGVKRWHI